MTSSECYKVNVYTSFGIYSYPVDNVDRAMEHADAIMTAKVYRRWNGHGVSFLPVNKVTVTGPNLESKYVDEFVRT